MRKTVRVCYMIDIIIVFWLGFIIANEIYSYKLQKVVANRKSRKYFILIEQRVLRSKKGEEEKGGGGGGCSVNIF